MNATIPDVAAAVLSVIAVCAVLAYFVLQVTMHRAPTGYSPVRNAVSDFGVGRTRGMFRLSAVAGIVAVTALAVALVATGTFTWRSSLVVLLVVVAVSRIGVAVFPTDVAGAPRTATGRTHLAFAIVQFIALVSAVTSNPFTPLGAGAAPRTTGQLLATVASVSLVGVILGVLPVVRRVFGLVERVFLYSTMSWMGLLGLVVLTR